MKAGVVITYISMGLGYLSSLICTPITIRLLGQSDYGLNSLITSLIDYMYLLTFGLESAYIRFFASYSNEKDREKIARLNGMYLTIYIVIGIIAGVIGAVLALNARSVLGNQLSDEEIYKAKYLIVIMTLNMICFFLGALFNAYITNEEKFIIQKILNMIKTVLGPAIVIPIIILGYGVIGMTVMVTLLNMSIILMRIWYCKKILKIPIVFKHFDRRLMREMYMFSAFIFINSLINQVNWNVDKYLLGIFHGTSEVAIYGLAAQINMYYRSLSVGIIGVFIPKVHRMIRGNVKEDELSSLFIRVGRLQFMLMALVMTGLVFFGKPFINMWAGDEYDKSYIIMLFLVIPGIVPLIQNLAIEIQRAKDMHKFRAMTYLFIAICNISISIPLAKRYGGVGTVIGTSLALVIGNWIVMNWYNHKKIGLDIPKYWKEILHFIPGLVLPIICGILLNLYVDLYKPIFFLLSIVIYTTVYAVSIWIFGMNKEEKALIGKPLKRIYGYLTFNGFLL